MARIRSIQIEHFRGIRAFSWLPSPGVNCLIGPGDSGKSSILDAIALCLGARRNVQLTDSDFHDLDVTTPISISITIGELDDDLKKLDIYGLFLRSFDASTGKIEDEPEKDGETALTVALTVRSDLEPNWSLYSLRAADQGQTRDLSWSDRLRLSPSRIGVMADYNLGWRRGSVLNRLSEQRADASAALAQVARDARIAFGTHAESQLSETLAIVAGTAKELGIPVGDYVKAMLDAASVSFSGGTICLHDDDGVPLSGLGLGSTRLLIAGLQRKAAAQSSVLLIDEIEQGLEPHRIIRLLNSVGAKEKAPPLQVFMTTHSPVALRELSGGQLFVVRQSQARHTCTLVGTLDSIQATIRSCPDAFLAPSVIVCEGASEVGFLRGLDQWRTGRGMVSMGALGVALVDGGGADKLYKRVGAFSVLEYRTAVLRDSDYLPTPDLERAFVESGGKVVGWRAGRTLEDELFLSLSESGVAKLLDRAIEQHGEGLIDDHIKSVSGGGLDLAGCKSRLTQEARGTLGKASRTRAGWFKTVTWMEAVAFDIVGPDLADAEGGFRAMIDDVFAWVGDA